MTDSSDHPPTGGVGEIALFGVLIGCLYLPNGNPAPGPKFGYKLDRFKRLAAYAAVLLDHDIPVALIGDFNVMPTELDVWRSEGCQASP